MIDNAEPLMSLTMVEVMLEIISLLVKAMICKGWDFNLLKSKSILDRLTSTKNV